MRSKEIGSEICDVPVKDAENAFFTNDLKWFITGRAALNFVIKDIKSKKKVKNALLPSWCCDSMIEPFLNNGIDVKFYSINYTNGKLVKDLNNLEGDILLNINYFGYEDNQTISFDGIVINDITHSVFTKQKESDYSICSLRKWAGFISGGFAYSKNGFQENSNFKECNEYYNLKSGAIKKKTEYLNNQTNNKDYLNDFTKAEEMLSSLYCYSAYMEDINKARHMDIETIRAKRQENAKELLKYVKDIAIYKDVKDDDCPLFVPILVENRDNLKKYLISKNIYCPVHWPLSSFHNIRDIDKYIYDHELSLVCDQRYSVEDMQFIGKCIKEFLC